MKNKLIMTVAVLVLVMPFVASAQESRSSFSERMKAIFERRPALVDEARKLPTGTMMENRARNGSEMMDRVKDMMKEAKVKYGFGGVISSVSGPEFTLIMRVRDGDVEGITTTTQAVTTSGTTVFRRDGATTTVAALTVGDMALVRGTLSTSTKVVAATSVDVFTASSARGSGYENSDGKNARGFFQSMFSRMKGIFQRN